MHTSATSGVSRNISRDNFGNAGTPTGVRTRVAVPVHRPIVSDLIRRANPFSELKDRVWTVQVRYQVPRQVVQHCLHEVNEHECPQWPGLIRAGTLDLMLRSFDKVLGNQPGSERKELEGEIMEHLKHHTIVRRGKKVWDDGWIEWEHTSRVFELFYVDLSIFERIFFTIDVTENRAILAQLCSTMLMLMIVLSNATWALSTLQSNRETPPGCTGNSVGDCEPEPRSFYQAFEAISVCLFTTELLLRLFTVHSVRFQLLDERFIKEVLLGFHVHLSAHCDEASAGEDDLQELDASATSDSLVSTGGSLETQSEDSWGYDSPESMDGKLLTLAKYVILPTTVIDLLAILPFWIGVFAGTSNGGALVIMRALRLTRIFRVVKFGGLDEASQIFARVMRSSLPAMAIMVFFISLLCCMFGTLMWFVEQGDWYPEGHEYLEAKNITGRGGWLRRTADIHCETGPNCMEETPFPSIIHSFWFIIVTITTVGYGAPDVPTTFIGKVIAAAGLQLGTIVLAMPIGVIGTNFSHEYQEMMAEIDRRERQKTVLQELTAAEKLQDELTAAEKDKLAVGIADSEALQKMAGVELKRVLEARTEVFGHAESLSKLWRESLPESAHEPLCRRLRHVVSEFLADDASQSAAVVGPQKPVIYLSYLSDLDELTKQANRLIISSVSTEAGATFGIAEARALRQAWSRFVDECWTYAAEVSEVEDEHDLPDFFQLKAALDCASSPTSAELANRRRLSATLQRAVKRGSVVGRWRRRAARSMSRSVSTRTHK